MPVAAVPPTPQTFVPNRAAEPSRILIGNMKANISNGVRDVVYVWNHSYSEPALQIADLMKIFKYLSDSPVMPKQMLMNETFRLHQVMDTKKMLKALDRYQKDVNRVYRTLFEYSSLIVGTKVGDITKEYKAMSRDMNRMVKSYNSLAKVTNGQYRSKVMPYYSLNLRK